MRTSISGTSPNENPLERATTRGHSEVAFTTQPDGPFQKLIECSCPICGDRSYTVDGKCAFRNSSILHWMDGERVKELMP